LAGYLEFHRLFSSLCRASIFAIASLRCRRKLSLAGFFGLACGRGYIASASVFCCARFGCCSLEAKFGQMVLALLVIFLA
jgi:hypothetical protein